MDNEEKILEMEMKLVKKGISMIADMITDLHTIVENWKDE